MAAQAIRKGRETDRRIVGYYGAGVMRLADLDDEGVEGDELKGNGVALWG